MRAGDLIRCGRCGSVFRAHACTAAHADGPLCPCRHAMSVHHLTDTGRYTYCTVWDPYRCTCMGYTG